MSLIAQLKADQLQARKDKNATKASTLTTLLGEIQTASLLTNEQKIAKYKTTDDDAIAALVIKYFVKNANQTISDVGGADKPAAATAVAEIAILEAYMPQQMGAAQIASVLTNFMIVGGDASRNKGALMKFLKENHNGQYDGKIASNVIDTLLTAA